MFSGILISDLSDHLPIFTIINIVKTNVNKTISYNIKKHINLNKLQHDLESFNWPDFNILDVVTAYNCFINTLQTKTFLNTLTKTQTNSLSIKQP